MGIPLRLWYNNRRENLTALFLPFAGNRKKAGDAIRTVRIEQ